jgi:hypothetical protein
MTIKIYKEITTKVGDYSVTYTEYLAPNAIILERRPNQYSREDVGTISLPKTQSDLDSLIKALTQFRNELYPKTVWVP